MGASHSDVDEHLESVLATKEYWEERYKIELKNYEDIGDEGEIWFGRSVENRIIRYFLDAGLRKDSRIIDLGCGNGSLLRYLRRLKFSYLNGVDYCEDAIRLARNIAEREMTNIDMPSINFQVFDLLGENTLNDRYDIVMDKGTWDAMSLCAEKEHRLSHYRNFIVNIITIKGIFIIFSCNFTKEELRKQFECKELCFETEIASTNSIIFGGKSGVTSTGAIFRRVI
uniref:Protein-lysine N-methyltransferase n=1 Tax=Parascaris univalens TaxID=6257 RepID=A0A915BK00_PARUN